jgi:hypothetical protein
MITFQKKLKRLLFSPFIWLVALVFLIEELIWDWTAAMMSRLGALRAVHAVEKHIIGLQPHWALFAFLLPSAILIPAKLFGLHAIAAGHWLFGSAIFIIAKIVGLALFSRIFNLTRTALMKLNWFAHLYVRVMYYRNRIHAYLENWPAYQFIKQSLHSVFFTAKASIVAIFNKFRN